MEIVEIFQEKLVKLNRLLGKIYSSILQQDDSSDNEIENSLKKLLSVLQKIILISNDLLICLKMKK